MPNNDVVPPASDRFSYTVSDGTYNATASVTVSIIDPITAPEDDEQTYGGQSITISPHGSDKSGSTFGIVSLNLQGTSGTAQISGDHRSIVYTPHPGLLGNDSFTYTLSDGTWSATGIVYVDVMLRIQLSKVNIIRRRYISARRQELMRWATPV